MFHNDLGQREAAKERIERCFEPVSDKLEADKTLVLVLDLNRYRIKKRDEYINIVVACQRHSMRTSI